MSGREIAVPKGASTQVAAFLQYWFLKIGNFERFFSIYSWYVNIYPIPPHPPPHCDPTLLGLWIYLRVLPHKLHIFWPFGFLEEHSSRFLSIFSYKI